MTDGGMRAVLLAERPMLLRLLTARLGNADDAEDVLQDMWLKLETSPAGPIAQPAAYLFRMANNIVIDRHRSAARHAARDGQWLDAQTTAEEIPGADQVLIARERLRAVEAELATLPERTAYVFRQFRFEGRTQKAIAEELGLSLSSVEKMLQAAYRKIHDAREAITAFPPEKRHGVEEER